MFVYQASDTGSWDVGFYGPAGFWVMESSWATPEEAAAHLSYLNGGTQAPLAMVDSIARSIARGFASIESSTDEQHATLTEAAHAVARALFTGEDQEGKRAWFLSEALANRQKSAGA